MERLTCKKCNLLKDANRVNFHWRNDTSTWRKTCKSCIVSKYDKAKASKINAEQYLKNREKILKEKKNYRLKNKDKLNVYNAEYKRKRYATDPCYKIRMIFSGRIRKSLTNHGGKNGSSFLDKLPYSLEDLKTHLEELFESWMSWDSFGIYNPKTWDDNDSSSWTWNIDHIVPHSKFKYSSMDSIEFKECWSLDNLRPLSSKDNMLDGVNRRRH